MKKLEEAIESVKDGSVLKIKKSNNLNYDSCIIIYDGSIFMDVKAVDLENFLDEFPNIKNQLDIGYIYKVNFFSESSKYQGTILKSIRDGKYKQTVKEDIVDNFEVISDDFLTCIIELDTKIASSNLKQKHHLKNKIIV